MSKWIKCKDKQPPYEKEVLFLHADGMCDIGSLHDTRYSNGGYWLMGAGICQHPKNAWAKIPVYWTELPAPPKEQAE